MSLAINSTFPRGATFTRMAIAMAVGKGEAADAAQYAASRWGDGNATTRIMKAAVSPGGANPGSAWGSALIDYTAAAAEYWGLVVQQSVFGRLTGLRMTPLAVRIIAATSGATASWVGEGAPMPLSTMGFTGSNLLELRLGAMIVISDELARSSDPQAEPIINSDFVRAMSVALDATFLNPANAGAANVSPASVTYGVTPTAATGTPTTDVDALIAAFQGDLDQAYFVGTPAHLASMVGPILPDIGARGGSLKGIPALPSRQAGNNLILLDPTSIAVAEDVVTLDTSTQGSVQMSDTPSPGQVQNVSLWQQNLISIRANKAINWQKVRVGSVQYISYGA